MSLEALSAIVQGKLEELGELGLRKGPESVICGVRPAEDGKGPRYYLSGCGQRQFLRMNSNSYLGLSRHPEVIQAEEEATRQYGSGPGAVRFISGTYDPHIELEKQLAQFHGRKACMIYNAAYAAVMGVLPPLIDKETIVVSDALNHNCIINAIRLAGPAEKKIYSHLDMNDLEVQIQSCIGKAERLLVVTDGIFSMRGDSVPLDEITAICRSFEDKFIQGIVTVVDDSHGVGAFGRTGRGVEEYTGVEADILVATLGKAFGVNGGYVVSSPSVIEYLRETSPFYVYSNPITPSEAAAASRALTLLDSPEGREQLMRLRGLVHRFEKGLVSLGYEIIESEHPVVPLMIRDTEKTATLTRYLFDHGILVTGLNYPVVPRGDEEIRFQICAEHTELDIDSVLKLLEKVSVS